MNTRRSAHVLGAALLAATATPVVAQPAVDEPPVQDAPAQSAPACEGDAKPITQQLDLQYREVACTLPDGTKDGPSLVLRGGSPGQVHIVQTYRAGKLHGTRQELGLNGKIVHQATYDRGLLAGEDVTYFETGEPLKRSWFKAGFEDGVTRMYDTEGRITIEESYVHGKRHGPTRAFSHGVPVYEGQFDHDRRSGHWRYFDDDGNVRVEGEMQGDRKVGAWGLLAPGGTLTLSSDWTFNAKKFQQHYGIAAGYQFPVAPIRGDWPRFTARQLSIGVAVEAGGACPDRSFTDCRELAAFGPMVQYSIARYHVDPPSPADLGIPGIDSLHWLADYRWFVRFKPYVGWQFNGSARQQIFGMRTGIGFEYPSIYDWAARTLGIWSIFVPPVWFDHIELMGDVGRGPDGRLEVLGGLGIGASL